MESPFFHNGANQIKYIDANVSRSRGAGEVTTSYTYNGDGARISQIVGTTTTTYVIDTATPLTMVLSETTGTQTTYYWQGLDTLAQKAGSTPQYFEYDGLGSVRQVTDSAGVVQLAQTFDPYGNGFSKSGTAATNLEYTGEQTDSNSFVFLRARYYSPGMGRFLNTDPSRWEQNPYLYGLSNPILSFDPTGLSVSGFEAVLPLLCSNQGINEPVSSNGKGKGIGPFETPAGWQQVENPVKVLQGSGDSAVIDPNDVRQNWLGDCYFAAALAEIALRNPTVIYRDIDENGDYTFDVTLPSIYVVKNLHPMYPIPTNPAKPQYIQNGDQGGPYIESWPLILENTWALYKGNNDIVQGYTNIGSGGSSGEVMQALTGVPSYWIPGNKLTYSDIKNHFDQGDLIILGSLQTANGLPEYAGDRPYANRLFTDHAYPVSAVDGGNVEVHNVWDWDHMSTKVDGNRLSVLFDGAYVNPGH